MQRLLAVAIFAFLLLPSCLDAVVGEQRTDERSHATDGGYDLGAVDLSAGEAWQEESGSVETLDAGVSLDLETSLDQGGEGQAATGDVGDDLRPDAMTADVQDGRAAGANDAGTVQLSDVPIDTRDTGVNDTRDGGVNDTRDATSSDIAETRDAAIEPDRQDGDGAIRADTKDTPTLARDANDAGDVPAVRLDSATPDGAPEVQTSCPDPQTLCNGACVDLQANRSNCGRCGYVCSYRVCINAHCQTCPSEQIACNGKCIDTLVDPANCGGCGQSCASGACRLGVCKASTAGHIVVMGHDFLTSNVDMDQLLGNAVFLAQAKQVQLAEYVGVANAIALSNSHAAITNVGASLGRTVIRSVVNTSNIASQLTMADVFLIQSQGLATNSIIQQLGQTWAPTLTNFVTTGGILVLLDASYPDNNGTSQILSTAGLMTIATNKVVTHETCSVTPLNDPVANGLPADYTCLQNSVSFTGGSGVHVVDDMGQPVVLHMSY